MSWQGRVIEQGSMPCPIVEGFAVDDWVVILDGDYVGEVGVLLGVTDTGAWAIRTTDNNTRWVHWSMFTHCSGAIAGWNDSQHVWRYQEYDIVLDTRTGGLCAVAGYETNPYGDIYILNIGHGLEILAHANRLEHTMQCHHCGLICGYKQYDYTHNICPTCSAVLKR